MRRVVSLWLPFWPTDRLRRHPYAALPADVPLVTRGHDGRRMIVAAACKAARALSLQAGMPLAHAQAMVPDLTIVDATPQEDAEALERLAAWCMRLSPMTAADPPDGVWIDVTGCAHLHGGELLMLAGISQSLAKLGLTGKMAIADTPGAAHAVARYGKQPVTVVEPGGQAEVLWPLSVIALRIGSVKSEGLRRLGLDRIEQLVNTPRGPPARRFGSEVMKRLDQALGTIREPIQPVLPPETIAIRRTFVEPLSTPEAFVTVILVLVSEACAELERRGQGARRLDLVFERIDATVQVIRIGTAKPVRDIRHLARLLDERIEDVDPAPGVEAMRLVLPLVEPLAYAQHNGGLAPDGKDQADMSELIDRLVNRLGPDKVYRLQVVESDVPERSQQAVPVNAPLPKVIPDSTWPRPVRLLKRPEPVEALAMLPDHPPKAFTWRRVRHRVMHADGPERITGEWWRRSSELVAVRDYWTVENLPISSRVAIMDAASVADYREIARRALPHFLFEYIDGGSYAEVTLRRNVADLEQISLRQRVLCDVSAIDLSAELFGRRQAMPVALGPIGLAGMTARRGEVQAAHAAQAAGIPFCLSTVSVCPLGEVAAAVSDPIWFQLYMIRDRGFMRDLLAQAQAAGCGALVFTVDMAVPGSRYRDYRSGLAGAPGWRGELRRFGQALLHPSWAWDVGLCGRPHHLGNVAPVLGGKTGLEDFFAWMRNNFDPAITWADLEFIRQSWNGPLIIKGILDPEDAAQAISVGADGIVVSNHGGRQLDGALSSTRALPAIADVVAGRISVLADGGVRSGLDVVRLLALGANGVLLGRAWAYALARGGGGGVRHVLRLIEAEMRVAMALTGTTRIDALNRSKLAS